jgi:CHRD domain
MKRTWFKRTPLVTALTASFAAFAFAGAAYAADVKVSLSGAQEVPPVKTEASGSGSFTINADKSVSGSVTTKGIKGTAAHLHEAAMGKNGGVAVPLTKSNDDTFAVAAGAKLTDAQYSAYQAGNLYVNVHSAANPDGEIRAQLKP